MYRQRLMAPLPTSWRIERLPRGAIPRHETGATAARDDAQRVYAWRSRVLKAARNIANKMLSDSSGSSGNVK